MVCGLDSRQLFLFLTGSYIERSRVSTPQLLACIRQRIDGARQVEDAAGPPPTLPRDWHHRFGSWPASDSESIGVEGPVENVDAANFTV